MFIRKMTYNQLLEYMYPDVNNSSSFAPYIGWQYIGPNFRMHDVDKFFIGLIDNNQLIGYSLFSEATNVLNLELRFGAKPTLELTYFEINHNFKGQHLSAKLTSGLDTILKDEVIYVDSFSKNGLISKLPQTLVKNTKFNKFIFSLKRHCERPL